MSYIFLPIILNTIINKSYFIWIISLVIVFFSVYYNRMVLNKKFLFHFLILNSLFLINIFLVSKNDIIIDIYIRFLKISTMGLFLSIQKLNYETLYTTWYGYAIINMIIQILSILKGTPEQISYMSFGSSLVLSFSIIFYRYLDKRKIINLIFAISIFASIVIHGNRGAILTCIVLILVLTYRKRNNKYLILPLIFIVLIAFYLIDIKKVIIQIIETTILFISKYNVSSYSLEKLLVGLNKGIGVSSSSRDILYSNAISIIKSGFQPRGVGYFESIYGMYVHNVFLDILIIFGYYSIFIFFLLSLSIFKFFSTEIDYKKKDMVILFLIISLVRLMLSGMFLYETLFWIAYGLIIKNLNLTKLIKKRDGDFLRG